MLGKTPPKQKPRLDGAPSRSQYLPTAGKCGAPSEKTTSGPPPIGGLRPGYNASPTSETWLTEHESLKKSSSDFGSIHSSNEEWHWAGEIEICGSKCRKELKW